MLIRFNITNFLSFKEETEFNMLSAKSLKTHEDHIYSLAKGVTVLKASAIYGANGAGKTNLIRAIDTLQSIVVDGCIPLVDHMRYRITPQNNSEPITLEIEFADQSEIFTYGITFQEDEVLEEWLYLTGGNNPRMIFSRGSGKDNKLARIQLAEEYLETEKSRMLVSLVEENLLMPHEPLLSKHHLFKIEELTHAYNWIKNKLIVFFPESASSLFNSLYSNKQESELSLKLLQTLDIGIDDITFIKEPLEKLFKEGIDKNQINEIKRKLDESNEPVVLTRDITAIKENDVYYYLKLQIKHGEAFFDVPEESDGTQRLLDFVPIIRELMNYDVTYVIDEIDRSLHPSMLHSLIRKIMADKTIRGQLIFTTHESGLLNCKTFRADEIWFVEKQNNATQLYTLNEFKPREDLDIEKGYLNGRFGAIPFLSKLDDLNW